MSISDVPAAISRNLPQVIEQNFAAQSAEGAVRLINGLTDRELSWLASRYTAHALNRGRSPQLLDILSAQLEPAQLGRLSQHFGFEDVYAAVNRVAPHKAGPALASMHTSSPSPLSGRAGKLADPLLDYTLNEIYLNFRTAPIGSLGVSASLYETAVFAGTRLSLSFSVGYTLGTGMQQGFEYLFPEAWGSFSDSFGSTVDGFANGVKDVLNGQAWENIGKKAKLEIGNLQRLLYMKWMYPGAKVGYEQGGGDLAVTKFWTDKWYDESCK